MKQVRKLMQSIFSSFKVGRKLLYIKLKEVVNVKLLQM